MSRCEDGAVLNRRVWQRAISIVATLKQHRAVGRSPVGVGDGKVAGPKEGEVGNGQRGWEAAAHDRRTEGRWIGG
jgi:hypothetical protein